MPCSASTAWIDRKSTRLNSSHSCFPYTTPFRAKNFRTASDVISGSTVLSPLPTLPRFSQPVRHEVDFGRYSALRAQQPIAAATAQGGIAGRHQGSRGQQVVDQPGPAERDALLGEHSLDHARVGVEAERGCGGAVGDSGLGEIGLAGEPAAADIEIG